MLRPALLVAAAAMTVGACSSSVSPAPSTTPPAAADRDCGVSPLLVPDCGAWLGSSIPSSDGSFDYAVGLQEYIDATGDDPDIIHLYFRGAIPLAAEEYRELVDRDGPDRMVLAAWKPAPEMTWRMIADGSADDAIDAAAGSMSAFGERFFLSIHHEPENDVVLSDGSGMTPQDYTDMYRHVVERLRVQGVTNAVYVMTYMGFERWAPIVDDLYPGDDVVDWIAYDPYGREGDRSIADVLNRPDEATGWPGFYGWAMAKAPDKPLMVAEWGFDLRDHDDAADVLDGLPDIVRRQFPSIKAMVYWNGRVERIDARMSQDTPGAERFRAAYRGVAADPFFNPLAR